VAQCLEDPRTAPFIVLGIQSLFQGLKVSWRLQADRRTRCSVSTTYAAAYLIVAGQAAFDRGAGVAMRLRQPPLPDVGASPDRPGRWGFCPVGDPVAHTHSGAVQAALLRMLKPDPLALLAARLKLPRACVKMIFASSPKAGVETL
jgi:hypothetical protein